MRRQASDRERDSTLRTGRSIKCGQNVGWGGESKGEVLGAKVACDRVDSMRIGAAWHRAGSEGAMGAKVKRALRASATVVRGHPVDVSWAVDVAVRDCNRSGGVGGRVGRRQCRVRSGRVRRKVRGTGDDGGTLGGGRSVDLRGKVDGDGATLRTLLGPGEIAAWARRAYRRVSS